jgi:hypothetical protein
VPEFRQQLPWDDAKQLMPGHYDMDREMPDETCNLDSVSILDDNTAVINKIERALLLNASIRYPIQDVSDCESPCTLGHLFACPPSFNSYKRF